VWCGVSNSIFKCQYANFHRHITKVAATVH
jgi:hypothetical protein